jgi:cation-transporting ATPase 13A2
MKFILILGLNALIAFLVTIPEFIDLLEKEIILPEDVIIRILDLITISVPPALPTCLAFGVYFSLRRLEK